MVASMEQRRAHQCDFTQLRIILAATLALALQGCASLSKNECLNADWYSIGYENGIHGQRETQITGHRKACAEHGVTPDLARFLEGREAGLRRFCEPRNGYRLGRAGTGYAGVCPQPMEADFLRAYGAGREVFDTQQHVNRLGRHINAQQTELKRLNEELADKQTELIAVGTTPRRRTLLLAELLELQENVKRVEREIYYTRIERDRERARLAQLERHGATR